MNRFVIPKRLKQWLKAPVFPGDKRKSFQAELINAFTLSLLVIMFLTLAFTSLVSSAKLPTNIITISTIIVLLACKYRLNHGQLEGIKLALPIILWLNSTVLVLWAGGTSNVSMIYYVTTAVFVSVLFGWRGAVSYFTITGIVTLGIALAETWGWMPERVFFTPPLNGWLILMLAILMCATIISLASDSRDKALSDLRESEEKYRALYEAVSEPLILTDATTGKIVDINQATCRVYGYSREELIDKPFADLSSNPVQTQATLPGSTSFATMQYHRRKANINFPIELDTGTFKLGGKLMCIEAVRDISERMDADQRERAISRRLTGIITSTGKLIQCKSLDEVYRQAVELGRSELGLERCALFLLDEQRTILTGTYGTDDHGQTTSEHAAFIPISKDDGITQNRQEKWNIHYDTASHWEGEQAVQTEQHWTVNTYIRSISGPIGVFFNDTNISHTAMDKYQQEAVAVYCSLLGSIIEQKRAEFRQQRVDDGLRAILSAADELVRCEELDHLYRRAVELGREKLGLERCALFLLEDDLKNLVGTFGTDEQGNTSDERGGRVALDQNGPILDASRGPWQIQTNSHSHINRGKQIYTHDHWSASTVIRSASRPLGVFFNDSFISHTPIDETQQETVAVYCSLLGNIIERKRAEAALQQANWIVENSSAIIFRWEAGAGAPIVYVSKNVRQLGYDADTLIQQRVLYDTLIHPDDLAYVLAQSAEFSLHGKGMLRQEYRLFTRDGQVRWMEDRSIAEHDSNRKLTHFQGIVVDITARKEAEQRERRTSQGLKSIIEAADELIQCNSLDELCRLSVVIARQKLNVERCALFLYDAEANRMQGTYGTDAQGNIISESSISWESDFSREREISAKSSWHYYNDHQKALIDGEYQIIGNGWIAETVLRLGNTPVGLFTNDTAISHKPMDSLQQELIALYGSLLGNIIKEKHTESALKQAALTLRISEERYRQAIEAAGAVPYLQDYGKQVFTFMGENIFQLTGFSADEMNPNFWDSLVEEAIPGGGAVGLSEKDAIPLARSGKLNQWLCDYRIRTRLGESRWIMDSAVEIFDEHNIARGSIGILQDITARKQAEAEREKLIAELETKNAELERFTYTVSHDLKSPLITIQGFLGFLQKDAEQGNFERLRSDMARITDATVRMQRLLNDLLELSRIGRIVNPPKHIPFSMIVDEALSLVKGRLDRGKVQVVISEELPFVYGDSARLVEVLQNLVDNAAKFMEGQENPKVEIGQMGKDAQGYPIFYVRDNGIGVPPQYHERIFGLFNKLDAKTEGTGVGLALVKRIIEVHGGKIWVESEGIGSGSTFYFSLPDTPPKQ